MISAETRTAHKTKVGRIFLTSVMAINKLKYTRAVLGKEVNMKLLLNIIYTLNLPSALFFGAFDFVYVVRMRI